MSTQPDQAPDCCCAVCGSTNIEYAVWHNPNTGTIGELFGSWNAGDNTFCADCDMEGRDPNPPLLDQSLDPKEFAKLRKLRTKLDEKAAKQEADEAARQAANAP